GRQHALAVVATTEMKATSILPLTWKTERSWRGIVPFTHLAREGRMTVTIGRRELLVALGVAAAWPLAGRAQQPQRTRLVGILMPFLKSDAAQQTRFRAFRQELTKLGWSEGSDVQFDVRWTTDNMGLVRTAATDLVKLKPDVIVTVGDWII